MRKDPLKALAKRVQGYSKPTQSLVYAIAHLAELVSWFSGQGKPIDGELQEQTKKLLSDYRTKFQFNQDGATLTDLDTYIREVIP